MALVRLELEGRSYFAVPVEHALAVARLLELGERAAAAVDGLGGFAWTPLLLSELRRLGSEHASRSRGSAARTGVGRGVDLRAASGHDRHLLTVEDASRLTGWSASYLCRLARTRPGLAVKRAGAWHLDAEQLRGLGGPACAGAASAGAAAGRAAPADQGDDRR